MIATLVKPGRGHPGRQESLPYRDGYLTWEECEERYPRLVRAMQNAAILSSSEAACALRSWRCRFRHDSCHGGEAVEHFGGVKAVITQAIAHRAIWRQSRKEWS